MVKWEYATVPLLVHVTKQILDNWGQDGWELVQVVPGPNGERRRLSQAGEARMTPKSASSSWDSTSRRSWRRSRRTFQRYVPGRTSTPPVSCRYAMAR